MAKHLNAIALFFVALGLFVLSYVVYYQTNYQNRWQIVLHEPGKTVVIDTHTGRVWDMNYEGKQVYDLKIIDPKEREVDIFPSKKK